jgi:RND family efflux transporter MFP subunit
MSMIKMNKTTVAVAAVLLPLLLALAYVALNSGPLAAVQVTTQKVQSKAISPALFGIGVIEARYSYRIGPTMTGHVLKLDAQVGDQVSAGQVLGEMDPVDMDNKIAAQQASIQRANAAVIAAEAKLRDAQARERYAKSQFERYQQLVKEKNISKESADAKQQEYQIAQASLAAARANLNAAREELEMLKASYNGLIEQRSQLRLMSPVDGLVVGRYIEPGSTVVAGQTVIEIIDPASIWVNVRFDQLQAGGLARGLDAVIVLRSRAGQRLAGRVERVEPLADAVTQEILAKVVFEQLPDPLPPLGELAEVTVNLPKLAAGPVISNAAIRRVKGQTGVWVIENGKHFFAPIEIGAADLDGWVQVLKGLDAGAEIVVYSKSEITPRSRLKVVDDLFGAQK